MHAESGGTARVQSTLQNVHSTSDTLDYDQAAGTIHYTGHVKAQKQDMILEAPDMVVHFRDQNVTDMTASGGVKVTREDQTGTGERAVYDQATDIVTLSGKNAEIRDTTHGVSTGSTLTTRNKGQHIVVQSGNGDRTVSQHPVQKKQ